MFLRPIASGITWTCRAENVPYISIVSFRDIATKKIPLKPLFIRFPLIFRSLGVWISQSFILQYFTVLQCSLNQIFLNLPLWAKNVALNGPCQEITIRKEEWLYFNSHRWNFWPIYQRGKCVDILLVRTEGKEMVIELHWQRFEEFLFFKSVKSLVVLYKIFKTKFLIKFSFICTKFNFNK